MSLLGRDDILEALRDLGGFAIKEGVALNLLAVGGAVMAIRHRAREATRDVDVLIRQPTDAAVVRKLAHLVAMDRDWPDNWLNDAAKGYLHGVDADTILFEAPGIQVYGISDAQLLAMKLSAWRDDVDIADARLLLRVLSGTEESVWASLEPFIVPGSELKARLAFQDLWEEMRNARD